MFRREGLSNCSVDIRAHVKELAKDNREKKNYRTSPQE